MSVKLDTLNTKENKVSKKQYKFEPIEEINVGLLHQVVKGSRTNFRNNTANKGKTMKFKLWKYSRHPNYLGELLFWFGICLIGMNSNAAPILIILCPIAMMLLFIFVSCPLMDERSLKNRSDYQEYMEKTSQLLLLPPKE